MKNKEHISAWIKSSNLKEAEMCMKSINCKSRSDYVDSAIEFYNGYIHNQNNEEYVNKNVVNTVQSIMNTFERRMSRILFKQAVEIAKVFWLVVRGFKLNPEEVNELHTDCVEEVKSINGALRMPYKSKEDDE